MTFQSFTLNPQILKAVIEAGYSEPTPIQQKAIPEIVRGFDIRGSAQTGTGKTAAFLLPALHLLSTTAGARGSGPRLLVLVPTRELGIQIAAQAEKYSKHLHNIKTVCISGGIPYQKQLPKISRPYDVLIATPGRLIDFMHQRKISLSRLEILVLDEADRMLDMGFVEAVDEIIAATPTTRQTLLFSATLSGSVRKLSQRILKDPIDVTVNNLNSKHQNIDQKFYFVNTIAHKNSILDHILSDKILCNALIFTSTKRHADQLAAELCEKGHNAGALHGNMNQRKRTQTIKDLKKGIINILVATDVAARGLDIDSITHVINFDFPQNAEDYIHRIGRTGRAGAKGTALSFASNRDRVMVKKLEELTKHTFEVLELPGLTNTQKTHPKKAFSKTRKPFFHKKNRVAR